MTDSGNSALVNVDGVEKIFHRGSEDIHVLKDLHLKVPMGEFLALMGPSGSGKSTLLNLIGGLDRLLAAHFPTLMERPGMAWFAQRRTRVDADDPAVRTRFRDRVLQVKARIEAVDPGKFGEAVAGFGV